MQGIWQALTLGFLETINMSKEEVRAHCGYKSVYIITIEAVKHFREEK